MYQMMPSQAGKAGKTDKAGKTGKTGMTGMAGMGGMNFPPLLHIVHHCQIICEQMVTMMLGTPNVSARRTQILLLRDCATICETLNAYLARNSPLAQMTAALCAQICEACGLECARFPDQASQHCSQVCLNCARECMAFAGAA